MTGAYTSAERRTLEDALRQGETPRCPACDAAVTTRPVAHPAQVSYVRHRVWVICPQCRRSASLDVPPPAR